MGALAIASSSLLMVTDIFVLVLPFKYLLGRSRLSCSAGEIEADEGGDTSDSIDELGLAVSIKLLFSETTTNASKHMHCLCHEIQSYPQGVQQQRCDV
jgi:hypothetical protein